MIKIIIVKSSVILDEVMKYSKHDAINQSKITQDDVKKIGQNVEYIIDKWKHLQASKLPSLSNGKIFIMNHTIFYNESNA